MTNRASNHRKSEAHSLELNESIISNNTKDEGVSKESIDIYDINNDKALDKCSKKKRKKKDISKISENLGDNLKCHYCQKEKLFIYCLKCRLSKSHVFCQSCIDGVYVSTLYNIASLY